MYSITICYPGESTTATYIGATEHQLHRLLFERLVVWLDDNGDTHLPDFWLDDYPPHEVTPSDPEAVQQWLDAFAKRPNRPTWTINTTVLPLERP
ncbi:hypothetical protein [Catelliglobosispora koreensis]|uniref:hypothetical protein n=1 Tax=Catelliglobosispora koreensis TaxID=129052 RepID=UPI0003720B55|nr:hypothetical protein [Catelliglobosispora koreensis]